MHNEIVIYSDIGESLWYEAVSAKSVKAQLDEMTGDVVVRINSPGGDVFDGFAMHNLLKSHSGRITVKIDGLAASAASVVAMAGDEIVMAENALMMIHDPWTMAVGSAADMRDTADLLDKVKGSIVTTYTSRTGMDSDMVADMMSAETWFDAAEALNVGLATGIEGTSDSIANLARPWICNAPEPSQEQSNTAYRVALMRRRLALIE